MAARIFKGAEFLITETGKDEIFVPEDFTDEQRQIGATTEQFVANEVIPAREEIEHQNFEKVVQLLRRCGELGLLMIDVPEEYGGLELDKATSMLAAEKISGSGSFSVAYSAHSGIGTLPLVYYGTEDQKSRYLNKLTSGEWIAAYCLTEPDSGSDALGAKASAMLSADGSHYILNGTKQFTTNGSIADLYTVFAKVDKEHFTAFLVERTMEGVSVGPEEKKMGIKGSSTTQVILDNVKVPAANVLGEIGKGHKIAFNVLNIGRFKLGAAVTGSAKFALADGVKYAVLRKQFGRPIASFGAIQEKLADMAADIFASEALVYRLAGLIDDRLATIPKETANYYDAYQKGIEEYAMECAIAKVFCSEMLAFVADQVVQIHGGYGFIQEYPAERYYRDERINRIFEGTNEINRLLIPGTLLTRALKGEIPLQREAMKALDALTTPSFDEPDDTVPFAAEKALLSGLKQLFLVVAGSAAQKYQARIKDEQEILMALADVVINLFAMESAVLRAEKILPRLSETKREAVSAAVRSFCFTANEKTASAARKAAFYCEEGDTLAVLLGAVRRFTRYNAVGLLQDKRILAQAVIEAEKYPF
ncbi:acyl-CoA dehydrogenase family protein [Geomonas subterranea]|uniref:Acyl-CoA dehydrogenase family protein n=1 Tax=Geomonas subterranea TaxID=2847989 RepID=A0ABX8LKH9_9BACT|nr:acyl-CoA dehydrogenase family protein [Geomonas subterranea]QXE91999.1 acyl-CoA dehydrogenase family protein [Geomonas subterranea]QXM09908.1 acyl-CoA dehydrogenase family protein [Geomonas subterranea]